MMPKKSGLTKAKVARLRKRMASHGVKDGKAVVELSARELQELLDAADPPAPKYDRTSVPRPTGDGPLHLYSVTLWVLAEPTDDPGLVTRHVASACLRHPTHPLTVVDGYGMAARNLTLSDPANRSGVGGMVQIGFANKPVPKRDKEVPVIRRIPA